MRTPSIALLASTALLLPAAAFTLPTGAASAATGVGIANCSKTKHGVTTRVKLRVEGHRTRVRVSHPRGTGAFHNVHVERVALTAFRSGPTFRSRGVHLGDATVYRLRNRNAVDVKFVLTNGHHTWVSCMYPATFPPCPTPAPGETGVVC
jgi:hypothetical protein